MDQTPDQTGGNEAVVEALVGGQHPGFFGILAGVSEDFSSRLLGPQEHLEVEKAQVFQGDEENDDHGCHFHEYPLFSCLDGHDVNRRPVIAILVYRSYLLRGGKVASKKHKA